MRSLSVRFILAALLFLTPQLCSAQYSDSLSFDFKPVQLIAPSVFLASGLAVHYASRDANFNVLPKSVDGKIQDFFYNDLRQGGKLPERHFDNYLQYLPLAMDLGLGMVGVKAKHSFTDRLIETALACAACAVMSGGTKQLFTSIRPNGGSKSFPSGHTDTAFVGCELVRMEYGGWWGLGAYAAGTTVAAMRLYNNWHWFSDVLFGMGIGILAANIGGWMLEPVKNLFNIPDCNWDGLSKRNGASVMLLPTIDPVSGSYCASLALTF